MSLEELRELTVDKFEGEVRDWRDQLFLQLEGVVQSFLVSNIPCQVHVNGSFLTWKPKPDDLDAMILIDDDLMQTLTDHQRSIIDEINDFQYSSLLDLSVYSTYPYGHKYYGTASDPRFYYEAYGLEHSEEWLKGYAILRLLETNVGLRLYR